MTGDHYQHNCPKKKKKEGESRSMTPYPRRDRTNTRERSSATQGNETFRRFHGYLGTWPWKILVQEEAAPKSESEAEPELEAEPEPEPESVPEPEPEPESESAPEPKSTVGAAECSAPYIPVTSDQQTDDTTPTADPEEGNSGEKDRGDDERARSWLWMNQWKK